MSKRPLMAVILAGIILGLAYLLYSVFIPTSQRSARVIDWIRHPQDHPEWAVQAGAPCLPGTPFVLPTNGLIGYLWDDSFRPGHRHSGLDIFGGTDLGQTPVVAAYPGYLTRQPEWRSAVIIRIPVDPLQPDRQIWLYYTHMADPDGNSFIASQFPPGTTEQFIEVGTLLGYQGNYTGNPANPSGIHLHFSIVLSDPQGDYLNELEIANTLDPSPYFGLPLYARTAPDQPIVCGLTTTEE